MHPVYRTAWALPIAFAVPLACAQPAQAIQRPAPQDARAVVPRVSYESPFAGYRSYTEEKAGSWKDANDTVGRIGGWRAYAKEAEEAKPAGESEPAGSGASRHQGHGGHPKK